MPSYRWAVQKSEGYNDDIPLLLVLFFILYSLHKGLQETEDYKWRHSFSVFFVTYFMLHTDGQYKSQKVINDDFFLLFFPLFLSCLHAAGQADSFSLFFFYLYYAFHAKGQNKSRKIINDDICSLFFFVIYFMPLYRWAIQVSED